MGGQTVREGLTVGRSLPAPAIVRLGWAGVNGALPRSTRRQLQARSSRTSRRGQRVTPGPDGLRSLTV